MYADIKGKVVLITGATGSLGNITAEAFAANGCKLALTGRKVDILKEVHSRCVAISKQPSNVYSAACDICNDGEVKKLVSAVIEKFGKLDVLLNFAGYYSTGTIADKDYQTEFEKNMLLNTTVVVRLCRHALPYLVKTSGIVVNASSINKPFETFSNFTCSKAALDMFTKSLALEFGPKGVRVNSVGISVMISTKSVIWPKMTKEDQEMMKKLADGVASKTPLRRACTAEELANVVLFLSSGASSFVNGALIPVDGGFSLS